MNLNILHIANNFTSNVLYDELISRLEKFNLNNTVIASTFDLSATKYSYSVHQCLRSNTFFNRLLFKNKIEKLWAFTESKVNFKQDVGIVHAHTLFSDGAIAYRAFKTYGTPYIVAIRNTDINVFFKYFIHLRPLGKKILKNASKIILISPAYKYKLKNYLTNDEFQNISEKIEIIPNGVGQIWLNNRNTEIHKVHSPVRLIYCGSVDKNKNILRIIKAAQEINKVVPVELKLIGVKPGQSDSYIKRIHKVCFKSDMKIELINKMPHKELIRHYRDSDIFIMPSHKETFGLVYVEALTQGLPIIYTKGEGLDGYFKDETVGLSVNSHSVEDIVCKVKDIITRYDTYAKQISGTDLNVFSWDYIASRYVELYSKIY